MMTLFEFIFLLRGVRISFYKDALRSAIPESDEQRQAIVKYHFENNPRYKLFMGSADKDNWATVPVIQKVQFQEGFQKWISTPYQNKKLFVNSTSGSSGVPLRFAKNWESHARTWALIQKRYIPHGIDVFRDLEARFYGIPLSNKSKYLEHKVKDWISNRVRFPVFDLSDEVLEKYYQRFGQKSFVYLNGYASSLVAFAQFIIRKKYAPLHSICPSLNACITTSEMCSAEDRAIMEKGFGVKVINEYGAAELDIIAFEDEDGDWMLNEENLYVEVVDQNNQPLEDGKEGKILITSLYNQAMPFIRYELGDRGVISKERKIGHRKLEKLTGRTNDMAVLPSGKIVPGLTFYYVTKSLLREDGLIRELVVKQTATDHFLIQYTAKRDLNDKEVEEVRNLLATYMEPGLRLDVERVNQIKRQKSGKLKQFEKIF